MTHRNGSMRRGLMLAALALLLTACAASSPPISPAPVQAAQMPALPPQARQPQVPSICSPTCSSALTAERESWQRSLTPPTPPEQPANGLTTAREKP